MNQNNLDKPYLLIQGSNSDVDQFENKISAAIEIGYDLAGELITQVITNNNGQAEIMLFQPMALDLADDDEDDDEYDDMEDSLATEESEEIIL